MGPRDRIRRAVSVGVAAIVAFALLAQAGVLPGWTVTVTGDLLADRVISLSFWALFAAAVGPTLGKVVAKLFRELYL